MKYCTHCGAEVLDEAEICVKCGCRIESQKQNSNNDTLGSLTKVFMIIFTVLIGLATFGIGLAWAIPMTISVCRKIDNNEPISIAMKICTLLFVSIVPGILLLCMQDN